MISLTIYLHEVRARLKSVLVWSLSVGALIFFFSSIYSGFADQAAVMNQMMEKFPPALSDAFGLGNVDLSSVMGYFGFLFIFAQLCLAIQAANYGIGLVSIEEIELTADFLLTRPVSRLQVLGSKLLAAGTALLITNLFTWGISFLSLALYSGGNPWEKARLVLVLSSIAVLQFWFVSIGLLISLLVRRVRSITPFSLGMGFGAYVLSAFSGIFADIKLEYITPFKQLDPAYMVNNGAYDSPLLMLNLAMSIIALVVSVVLYLRRDIHAVS